jgi:hypothetical protein
MTSPDFFTCLEHGLEFLTDQEIEDFATDLTPKSFIPIDRTLTELEIHNYYLNSIK